MKDRRWCAGAIAVVVACEAGEDVAFGPPPPQDGGAIADANAAGDGGHDSEPARAEVEPGEANAGGAATSWVFDARAFAQPLADLSGVSRTAYFAGQAIFEMSWTPPSASAGDRGGLGPTYNSTSCQACHFANGRGAPPLASGDPMVSALLRVSIEGSTDHGAPAPHPLYGDQIQPRAIAGAAAEGAVRVNYIEETGSYADGTTYTLQRPTVTFEPGLGEPGNGLLVSPRVATSTIGMGLLAAVSEADIVARADPNDSDGDGISGRPNRVWDVVASSHALGRFGWKANQPTIAQQNAAAFVGDIGITSVLFPLENCPPKQTGCTAAPSGRSPELDEARLDAITTFMRATAVPGRRDIDNPTVLRGKHLFRSVGCATCHAPTMRTGVVSDLPALSNQSIWPYTDLLLHDMGEPLADGRPDFQATGREWRTPPLWGIGLQATVSGHDRLLHDGRARGLAEAILWHGGEAQRSADAFRALSAPDRDALVSFLRSL